MRMSISRLAGAVVLGVGLVADQALKIWLLGPFQLAEKGRVTILPFLDLVLAWNRGVSYGLFPMEGDAGRYFFAAVGLAGAVFFGVWLWRADRLLPALACGLVAAGALGNALDRIRHGAVVDFVLLHAGRFEWYVFNLADVWIVAGVVGLLMAWMAEGRGRQPPGRDDLEGRPEKATDG